jgi:hypothetical protein
LYSEKVSRGVRSSDSDPVTTIIIDDDEDDSSNINEQPHADPSSSRLPPPYISYNSMDSEIAVQGYPYPASIPKVGRGCLVSYMLGSSSPGFTLGKGWGWDATAWDYDLIEFDPVREARLRRERHKSSGSTSVGSSTPTKSSTPPVDSPSYIPPTFEELLAARPHAHAFFCRKTSEWRIVTPWNPSVNDDVEETDKPLVRHFVNLRRRVDPRFVLSPGFDGRLGSPGAQCLQSAPSPASVPDPSPETSWWDLHSCDSTSLSIVVSPPGAIPGVISSELVDEFESERRKNPAPGSNPMESVLSAWDYIWK